MPQDTLHFDQPPIDLFAAADQYWEARAGWIDRGKPFNAEQKAAVQAAAQNLQAAALAFAAYHAELMERANKAALEAAQKTREAQYKQQQGA